eukprot:1186395-Rhodomonas_salina.2
MSAPGPIVCAIDVLVPASAAHSMRSTSRGKSSERKQRAAQHHLKQEQSAWPGSCSAEMEEADRLAGRCWDLFSC